MPLTKYHVAATKQHDNKYRASTPYIQYDANENWKNGQDLDRYLSDGEGLLDQDLVAWINVGREHIARQEDLPAVPNFGTGFHFAPFNFFSQDVAATRHFDPAANPRSASSRASCARTPLHPSTATW